MPFGNGRGPQSGGPGMGWRRGWRGGVGEGCGRGRRGRCIEKEEDRKRLEARASWLEAKLARVRERLGALSSQPSERKEGDAA